MYLAYTYLITNKITGQFYYGSRYRNIKFKRTPEEDFWIYYFTSSVRIKQLIGQYGKDSFDISIIMQDKDYDKCYWAEQDLIKENIKNKLCLNGTYLDSESNEIKFSMAGLSHSDKTKSKLSKSHQGKTFTNSHKENISVSNKGKHNIPCPEEQRKRQSELMSGRPPWNSGLLATDTAKNNQSAALKGKPWSQARRDAQTAKLIIPADIKIII